MTARIDTSPEAVARVIARERHRQFPYSVEGLETASLLEALAARVKELEEALQNITQQAAKDARDVFSGYKTAREAVDYMEQLIYAALTRKGATEYEIKVAKMKRDFPNGI